MFGPAPPPNDRVANGGRGESAPCRVVDELLDRSPMGGRLVPVASTVGVPDLHLSVGIAGGDLVRQRCKDSGCGGLLLRRGSPVRIYVVGGGERHSGYAETIRGQLAQKYPTGTVTAEFLTPGFSPNWMPHVHTVERNIHSFDAVVIIYATRTTFGEWVRDIARKAGKPFRTCGRQGRGAVLHTVMKSVDECVPIGSLRK